MPICAIPGCLKKHHAKGYCQLHYDKCRRKDCSTTKAKDKLCTHRTFKNSEQCTLKQYAKDLCNKHYQTWRLKNKKDTYNGSY
jgi:hypothetical protein